MLAKVKIIGLIALVSAALPAGDARSQFGGYGGFSTTAMLGGQQTVSAAGNASLHKEPTAMRMFLQLSGRGKTLEEAAQSIADRCEAVTAQLESLGADTDSISFGRPAISDAQSAQKQQLETMIRERMAGSGRAVPKGLKIPKSFTVNRTLTVEWPLLSGEPERTMIAVHALQEKIKAADLAGVKETQAELSPEERELAEEFAAPSRSYDPYGEEEVQPGVPHFVFVARVSDAEHDKAAVEAFAKARHSAARLAKAAGVELGPLASLAGGASSDSGDGMSSYERRMYRAMQGIVGPEFGAGGEADDESEIVGPNSNSLTYRVTITAVFGLKQ